jgi:hypothetical protein
VFVIAEDVNAEAWVDGGVHRLGNVTLKDMVVPATVTFEIFNPPALPSCRKLLGFVASFISVLPTADEKKALFGLPLTVKVPSGL